MLILSIASVAELILNSLINHSPGQTAILWETLVRIASHLVNIQTIYLQKYKMKALPLHEPGCCEGFNITTTVC